MRLQRRLLSLLPALALFVGSLALQSGLVHATVRMAINTCTNDGELQSAVSTASPGSTITFDCDGDVPISGTLVITKNLTLDGNGHKVTLDGQQVRQVIFVNTSVTFKLRGLTVANGKSNSTSGGGLFNNGGIVTISNSTFFNNKSPDNGGGLENTEHGKMTINNSIFVHNSTNDDGGGLSNDPGGIVMISDNSVFAKNSASAGGGLFNFNSGTVTLSNSTISNNTANVAGGGLDNTGTVTLSNSTISNNTANILGGGLLNSGTMSISKGLISHNSAIFGGGIFTSPNTTTTIKEGSTFSFNFAGTAGGDIDNAGHTILRESRIINNLTSGNTEGSGIDNEKSGTMSISHSSINTNSRPGGGLHNDSPTPNQVIIDHSELERNDPANCTGLPITDGGHNEFSDTSCHFANS